MYYVDFFGYCVKIRTFHLYTQDSPSTIFDISRTFEPQDPSNEKPRVKRVDSNGSTMFRFMVTFPSTSL